MLRILKISGGVVAFAGCVGLAVFSTSKIYSKTDPTELLRWDDEEIVAMGHDLYESDCASCHGSLDASQSERLRISQENSAPPHDATGHTWQHPDYVLFELTKTGEVAELCKTLDGSGMPIFGDELSDREIVAVLSFIKSRWPEDLRAQQSSINSLYAAQNAAVRDLIDASAD